MKNLDIYGAADFGKVSDIVGNMTDDQVALMAQFYYLTRAKTQQDAGLYAMQQQGYSDDEVNARKAETADILAYQQDQIDACYGQIATLGIPIQYVGQVVYSSVPGWCADSQCCVPDWYYDGGYYVGCAFNRDYCGDFGQHVCGAYYDRGSHFSSVYDRNGYLNKSINKARHQANWYRNHDWQGNLRYDRFARHGDNPDGHGSSQDGVHGANRHGRQSGNQLATNMRNHVGGHDGAVSHARAEPRQHHSGGGQLAAYRQKQGATRDSAPSTFKTRHKAASPQGKHVSATRPSKSQHRGANTNRPTPKAQHQAAKPHAQHASAPRPHAAHAGNARPAAHAQPHPQHAAQSNAKPAEHDKHR